VKMAPLYNEGKLIPEALDKDIADDVERKLATDVALQTLNTIEDVLQTFEFPHKKKKKTKSLLPKRLCARIGVPLMIFLFVVGAAAAMAVLLLEQMARCELSASAQLHDNIFVRRCLLIVGCSTRSGWRHCPYDSACAIHGDEVVTLAQSDNNPRRNRARSKTCQACSITRLLPC
jgi:hypothetical protein